MTTRQSVGPAPLPAAFSALVPNFQISDPLDAPPLRWGILGAGGIARHFATDVPAYSSQQVVAVGSRSQERADAFAAEMGLPFAYGSYEDLVASDEVDIIYVATPHSRHRDDALLALRAGKPVLVEKAFTMTAAEAEEIFAEARSQGLFAMEAMWSRHLPHYRFIKSLIESGAGGKVVAAAADHGQSLRHVPRLMQPELGGGALLDLNVYSLHFVHHALGVPDRLESLGRGTGTGVDAAEMVIGRYADTLSVASANMDGISPTAGSLTFEKFSIELPDLFYRPTPVHLRRYQGADAGEDVEWDASFPGGFQYQAAEAARCVTAGLLESPIVTWQDTLEVMRIMDQVREQISDSL